MSDRRFRDDRLAVLIDADNASARLIEPLLEEVAKYGTAHVKRIYGDWTSTQLSGWKEKLHVFAIQPVQQYSYTSGKNATDSALIIDAMDLLYTENFDGFCIISSDSDFTKLACRLREAGLFVYGFGKKQTPLPFQKACDKFTYTEIFEEHGATGAAVLTLASNSVESTVKNGSTNGNSTNAKSETKTEKAKQATEQTTKLQLDKEAIVLLKTAYKAAAGEDGWANLGAFGSQINKISPAFDPRNYGYSKLGQLVKETDIFEIQEVTSENNPVAKVLYIRLGASN